MSNWIIRRAFIEDAEELAICIDAAYSIYQDRITDLPAVSESVADDIRNKLVWVAVVGGKTVGGLILAHDNDGLVLENVAMKPDATGMGIGRALIELAENEAGRLGLHEMRLNTHIKMSENISLYKHFGWREVGRSGNKVKMQKSL